MKVIDLVVSVNRKVTSYIQFINTIAEIGKSQSRIYIRLVAAMTAAATVLSMFSILLIQAPRLRLDKLLPMRRVLNNITHFFKLITKFIRLSPILSRTSLSAFSSYF